MLIIDIQNGLNSKTSHIVHIIYRGTFTTITQHLILLRHKEKKCLKKAMGLASAEFRIQ